MKTLLNENSFISLGLAIILFGGVAWLTNLAFKTEASAESLKKIELKQNAIEEIKTDVAVIKFKLEKIEQKLDRR